MRRCGQRHGPAIGLLDFMAELTVEGANVSAEERGELLVQKRRLSRQMLDFALQDLLPRRAARLLRRGAYRPAPPAGAAHRGLGLRQTAGSG